MEENEVVPSGWTHVALVRTAEGEVVVRSWETTSRIETETERLSSVASLEALQRPAATLLHVVFNLDRARGLGIARQVEASNPHQLNTLLELTPNTTVFRESVHLGNIPTGRKAT